MAKEIEIKFRLTDADAMRHALRTADACCIGTVLETNEFFDWPDARLRATDCGLRIRRAAGVAAGDDAKVPAGRVTVTYKGPRQGGAFKVREEHEFSADDADAVTAVLAGLGLHHALTFEKRRESWLCANCKVEIDELPHLGMFLEIEGPDEASISAVREQLGLAKAAVEPRPYTAMVHEYLESRGGEASLTF